MGDTGQGTSNGRNGGGASRPSAAKAANATNTNGVMTTAAEARLFKNAHVMAQPPGGPTSRNPSSEVATYQAQMGQTGNEAGRVGIPPHQKLYCGTSKSYNINAYLNSDGTKIKARGSQWDQLGYTKSDIKRDIATIDRGMKGLPRDTKLTRFVYGDQLGAMLGNTSINNSTIDSLITALKSGNTSAVASFRSNLKNANYTHKAYTSTTYVQKHPAFDQRDVRLNLVARKGTKAIVTNNHAEHEILLGRGQKYNFTGNFRVQTTAAGVDQLVLDVYI